MAQGNRVCVGLICHRRRPKQTVVCHTSSHLFALAPERRKVFGKPRLRTRRGRDPAVAAARRAARHLEERLGSGFAFECLPPYAPELNPAEGVWRHTQYADLADFIPDDVDPLRVEVAGSIKDQRCSPPPLRSFFVHAKLGP